MEIRWLSVNQQLQKYHTAAISTADLIEVQNTCIKYEEDLAKAYGIDIQEKNWRTQLKDKINDGYGKSHRKGRHLHSITTEELYNILLRQDAITEFLNKHFSSFGGGNALANKIEEDIKKLKNQDTEVTISMVQGDIDEYIASYFRGLQYKSGKVMNTEGPSTAFPLKVKFDITQEVPDLGVTLHFENKKGIKPNYLNSSFHFGTFSTVEAFLGGDAFEELRRDIIKIIYEGRVNIESSQSDKKSWKYKCEGYVKLAVAYIAWRLKEGNILFTNSRGDINFGSEIIDGFIGRNGRLGIDAYSDYKGKKGTDLNKVDERYIASWQEEAMRHKDEISNLVFEKLRKASGNRLQVKVWYGTSNKGLSS